MKMYLLKYENLEKFPECSIPPDNPWNEELLGGGKKIENIHDLPIKFQVDNKYPLKDRPYCAKEFLISLKFAEVLKNLTSEYQEFPAEIYRKEDFISRDYLVFELTSTYPAIDLEKSEYRRQIGNTLMGLKKIVLSKEKLSQIPENIQIFRMSEFFPKIIVSEKAKNKIEEAGILGIDFEELEIN